MKRRVFVLIIAAALVLALLIWLLWANSSPAATQVTVASGALPEAFEGFKIAHVSDLHNAVFGRKNEKLLSLIRAAEPDIIAITGDLIDSRHTDIDSALAFVEAAAEIAPVYYVTGNHESRLDFDEIEPRLIAAGGRVLRNEAEDIGHGGERIRLAGIDDPSFIRTGGTAKERAAAELEQLGDGGGTFTVLLAHRPELVEVYAEYGARPGPERARPRRAGSPAAPRRAIRAGSGAAAGVRLRALQPGRNADGRLARPGKQRGAAAREQPPGTCDRDSFALTQKGSQSPSGLRAFFHSVPSAGSVGSALGAGVAVGVGVG